MSSQDDRPLILSPLAQQDIINILRYTGERWGEDQLHRYRDKLDDALRLLEQHPEIGHTHAALSEAHRLHTVGAHVMIYRIEPLPISIVRVLHQHMSLLAHLTQEHF